MKNIKDTNFIEFVNEVKARIYESQYKAHRAVNHELIDLYWGLGELIIDKQNRFGWGKSVVENLSTELHKEFVGVKGFSVQNLWMMRKFF